MNWTLIAAETFSVTGPSEVVERNMKSILPIQWSFFYIFTIIREGEIWTLLLLFKQEHFDDNFQMNENELYMNVNLCPKGWKYFS